MSADASVNGAEPIFANLEGAQHIATPMTIHVDVDAAYVRSILHAQHHSPNAKDAPVQAKFGYYDNWTARMDAAWKISKKMVQTVARNEGNWYIIEKAAVFNE